MFVEITDFNKARELHRAGLLWAKDEVQPEGMSTVGRYWGTFSDDGETLCKCSWAKSTFYILVED